MAEWLFEILSEEIPASMQKRAQEQLKSLAETCLQEKGLSFETIKTFVTPRRLTLVVEGLPLYTLENIEEKKGPRADASPEVIDAFLKSTNIKREDCEIRDTPKGSFLFACKKEPPKPTRDVLPHISLSLLERFRWPKSMRWGQLSTTWIRPIRGFLNVFEGEIVPFTYADIKASSVTHGHRFLASQPFSATNFQEYERGLRKHFVILDWDERRKLIDEGIIQRAKDLHLTPLKDEALLDEVAGLVEWPIALKGAVDNQFMELPLEVITTPMRVHQRYFPFVDAHGDLAPFFGVVANTEARDGGTIIIKGNERVLRARLADAQFFWQQDQKKPLEHFNNSLKTRLFHQHLGSLFDKTERLVKLTTYIAKQLGIDHQDVSRSALLSKADLASLMVSEFPELQGTMGRYYAQNQGESQSVALAIEEHYWPKASGGTIPEALPSLILAIADRIDTLMGFFAIGISPSGSKDPFALRRAALALISLCLAPHFSLSLFDVLGVAYDGYVWEELNPPHFKTKEEAVHALWYFLLERFKFTLKDNQGSAYDHVEAVLSVAQEQSTFTDLALRVQALDQLMEGENGQNLFISYKRASNILRIEEEKDNQKYEGNVQENYLSKPEERELFLNLKKKLPEIQDLVKQDHFVEAVQNLGALRPFVDQFFEHVIVNTDEKAVRANRLHLLALLRKTLHQVADFSKIEGK